LPTLDEFRAVFLKQVDAFNRRDWDAIVDGLPERFEWHFLEDLIDRRPAGPKELPAAFDDLLSQFPDWRVDPVEIVETAPGTFVVRMLGQGAGAASGARIQLDLGQVWEFEGDQAVRCREFPGFSEALAGAGASRAPGDA
jgi:hypothetical protein